MKIEKELLKSLNNQINLEFVSAYLYLSLELSFANMHLDGVAKWLKKQAIEELEHAEKLILLTDVKGVLRDPKDDSILLFSKIRLSVYCPDSEMMAHQGMKDT